MKIKRLFHSKSRVFLMVSLALVVSSIIIVITIYQGELKVAENIYKQESLSDVQLIYSLLNKDALAKLYISENTHEPSKKEIFTWLSHSLVNNSDISSIYVREIRSDMTKQNRTKNIIFINSKKVYKKMNVFTEEEPAFMDVLDKVLKSKKSHASEIYTDSYGIWISALMPIIDKNGNIYMVLGIDKDASKLKKGQDYYSISITVLALVFLFITLYFITSIRMFESNKFLNLKIKESNEALEKQLQYVMENEKMVALGNLVAGVAHEINTPLGVAITSVTYLESINNKYKEKLDNSTMTKNDLFEMMSKIHESTKIIIKNLDSAANLIQSFKRIAVDQSSNAVTTYNLKDLLNSVVISLKHEYKLLNVKIIVDAPVNLNIHSDPGAMVQIITNFIMNGIKHGRVPEKELIIKLMVEENEERVHLVYLDNGKGIDSIHLPHVFEPFYTTSRANGGSGLGLNIVYNLVNQTLKGNIRVTSNLGQETQFIIDFPKETCLEKELLKDLDKEVEI